MATVQDYRQARRIGQISLTNLIARNIAEGEGFGSVGKAISQKFAARKTRIKEAFDPLNIASMMVGRTKLGTAILGRLMGRSAEDIQYFARKGAGREAAYDPFFSRVSPGSLQPVKQSEGVADVFAKIYNLLKKNIDDENRRKEIERNFREEEALEDERRHKELLAAITGKGKAKVVSVEKKEGGGLFDFIKGMLAGLKDFVNKIKDGLSWLYTALTPILSLFKSGLLSILQGLVKAGGWLLKGIRAMGLGPVALVAALGAAIFELWREFTNAENAARKAAEEGDVEGLKKALEPMISDEAAASGVTASDLAKSYLKSAKSEKAKEALAQMEEGARSGLSFKEHYDQYLADKGYYASMGYKNLKREPVPEQLKKEAAEFANAQVKKQQEKTSTPAKQKAEEAIPGQDLPELPEIFKSGGLGSEKASASPVSSVATSTPAAETATSAASPMPNAPSIPPVMTATNQNMELQDDYNIAMSSEPIVFNKTSTTGMNLGSPDTGTVTGAASIRDDALENIMANLRRRSTVM